MIPRRALCDLGRGGVFGAGAGVRTRTGDLRITSALLYQLSYTGKLAVPTGFEPVPQP